MSKMWMQTKVGLCLFLLVGSLSLESILGNTVTISTGTVGNVGGSVELTCSLNYTTGTLQLLFWYLNGNSGMQRNPSTCAKVTTPPVYDESRYNFACNVSSFTFKLTISNLTVNDSGCWNCSVSFSDTFPTNRDSACITVTSTTSSTTAVTTTTTATTVTMTTTTTTMSTTNTDMRTASSEMRTTNTEKTTNNEKTTNTGRGTTLSIKATSSCPLPVLAIIGISVSGFLSILLILIICCCCSCCYLYHCRKEQNAEIYESKSVEANNTEDINNHIKIQAETPNQFKEVQTNDGTLNCKPETTML